jgi:transposase
MCQGVVARLLNRSGHCQVRKVASLLAKPLRACANRDAVRLFAEICRADTVYPIIRGVLQASRCEGVCPCPRSNHTSIGAHLGAVPCPALPQRESDHPLGCHRPRIPDWVVFEKLIQILVFGCAYWRIADGSCSATTLRRRRDEWIEAGLMEAIEDMAREAYDRAIGLDLADVAVDCCITKAPCGGEKAGRNPVDRGKRGLKRSTMVDAEGIPLGAMAAPANRHDSPLLAPTLDALPTLGGLPEPVNVHLDRAYDSNVTRRLLQERGLEGVISEKGKPAPLGATKRWVVERTNSWQNAHKKLL